MFPRGEVNISLMLDAGRDPLYRGLAATVCRVQRNEKAAPEGAA
jgi:hypothetical protein